MVKEELDGEDELHGLTHEKKDGPYLVRPVTVKGT